MRSNPFRVTLALVGFGGLILGVMLAAISASLVGNADVLDPTSLANAATAGAIGNGLIALGIPFLAGWLVVRAIQWVPRPLDASVDAELEAFKKRDRDPNA
jgi:hypothetical protein